MPLPPRRIAVVRALQLGDFLTAVPAIRALRTAFPDAEITMIGLPWARSMWERFHAYIDRFADFPGFPGIDEVPYQAERTRAFLEEQAAYRYDLALQMHGNGQVSNRFTLGLGARITAGFYAGPETARGLTLAAPYPDGVPEVLRNLGLAELVGASSRGTWLEFPLLPQDRLEAATLLGERDERPIIGVHAGARDPARRWGTEPFALVADGLAERAGARIVLTGAASEAETVNRVAALMRRPALNLSGKTSLGGLAAVIESLDLLVTNDTGPAHLADALKVPSVTVFGPADPVRWGALDRALHPLVRRPVEPRAVVELARGLLKSEQEPTAKAVQADLAGARPWR